MPITDEELVRRFTFNEHSREDNAVAHDTIRTWGLAYARAIVDLTPEGREQALALTALQEAVMWANTALATHYER